jgi:hypothetical protein
MSSDDFPYRHFVYLNGDEVLNIAAVIEGGEVIEEIHTLAKGFGGHFGLKFALAAVSPELGVGGHRRFEKELKLRRTVYVQADKVLTKLKNSRGLVSSPGQGATENKIINCDIDLELLRKQFGHQRPRWNTKIISSRWWKIFTRDKAVQLKEDRIDFFGQETFPVEFPVLSSDSTDGIAKAHILAILDAQWMLDLTSFSRRATVIGQIIGVARPGEQLVYGANADGALFDFCSSDSQLTGTTDSSAKATAEAHSHGGTRSMRAQNSRKLLPSSDEPHERESSAGRGTRANLPDPANRPDSQATDADNEISQRRLYKLLHLFKSRKRHHAAESHESTGVGPVQLNNAEGKLVQHSVEHPCKASVVVRPFMIYT